MEGRGYPIPNGKCRAWRHRVAANVSGLQLTDFGILDVRSVAEGGLHASEVLPAYVESEHADQGKLLPYGDRIGRGSVFRRLGFLAERAGIPDMEFGKACRRAIIMGVSRLDPNGPQKAQILARCNLRVNSQ